MHIVCITFTEGSVKGQCYFISHRTTRWFKHQRPKWNKHV